MTGPDYPFDTPPDCENHGFLFWKDPEVADHAAARALGFGAVFGQTSDGRRFRAVLDAEGRVVLRDPDPCTLTAGVFIATLDLMAVKRMFATADKEKPCRRN